jgi:UDP-N-acetyl-D-mannosaminouronate:lipid I N-acetyl-D-mannosaminouronosyltransferase
MEIIRIKDVNVYPFKNMDELIAYSEGNKKLYLSLNAEIIVRAKGDVANLINEHVGYADGFGAVKVLKSKGAKDIERIPGCELWLELVKRYHSCKSFYLIGATEETVQATVAKLKEMYPDIRICGYRNGYIKTAEERETVIRDVVEKKPEYVFVAMGFPAQEKLMYDMYQKYKAVYLNLGGSFDVFTGKVSRAPKFLQKMGLEWLYRFITHPSRFKRQIVYLQFSWAYLRNKL